MQMHWVAVGSNHATAGQNWIAESQIPCLCMQVVLTSVEPSAKNHEASFDAYEYTVHSHLYNTDDVPTAKFSYDMSPIQIIVTERKKALYHFITTTCAIVGGVFTVTGILDGILYGAGRLAKKVDLGKQG